MGTITDQGAAYVPVRRDEGIKPTHTHVVLEDREDFVVRSGLTRDLLLWDKVMSRQYDREKQQFIFAAFLAHAAARREGFFPGTFDEFCVLVEDLTPVRAADADPEPVDQPVPPTTRTAPPA